MDKHWRHYCTVSVVHFMAYPQTIGGEGPIVETLTEIAEDPFFDGVEVGWIKDPTVRKDAIRVLENSHIKVGYGAQSSLLLQKLNLNSLDESERQRAIKQLKANVDEASEIGAQRVGFLSGRDPGDADRPAALDALVKSMDEVCTYAADKGIALTCETFDRDIDKKCLIGPTPYAVEFANRVRQKHPSFGLLYDLSHQPLLHETASEALPQLKDVLVHAHVGNAVIHADRAGYGDLHPRFGYPGSENDLDELVDFLRVLFQIGYLSDERTDRPWIGFEVKPQDDTETSAQIIASTKRVWQDAWALV